MSCPTKAREVGVLSTSPVLQRKAILYVSFLSVLAFVKGMGPQAGSEDGGEGNEAVSAVSGLACTHIFSIHWNC